MNLAWTKHIKDPKEKADFEKYIRNQRQLLERLRDIINESEKDLDVNEISFKSYDSPNWSHKQADMNGFRRCLNMFKKLVDLDQENKENK